jgi:cyanate permease
MGALLGPIYSLPCQLLRGRGAAAGIALVAALSAVGGLIGPYLIGVLKDATGGYVVPLLLLSALVAIAAVVALRLRIERPISLAPSPAGSAS